LINNYFILKAQVDYLKNLSSSYLIKNVFSTEKNLIVFHLLTDNGKEVYLTLILEKNLECLFVEDDKSIPAKNILYLFDNVLNTSITDIRIEDKNRIVTLELSDSCSIVFFAFPKYSNLFVCKDRVIVDCYSDKATFLNTQIDALLPKRNADATPVESTDISSYLKNHYSYIGKQYREDIIQRFGNDESVIYESDITDYVNTILTPKEFIIYNNEETIVPSLTPLLAYENYSRENHKYINELITHFYRRFKFYSSRKEIKSSLTDSVDAKIKRTKSRISNLQTAITEAGNSDKFKKYGDILFSNIHNIEKGLSVYEHTAEETGEKEKIKLNPLISISNNATNYYNKYKGMKNSVAELEKKVKVLGKELIELEKQRESLIEENNFKNLKKMSKAEEKEMETEKLPFRIFKIDEKFEVWVGKDSASNDLLTMKYASQYDLWFHVRGSSGSHTILKFLDKNLTPEKSLILQAAAIAAYYSKARNGKHVPVAYCERKYVKKRKGFNQGAVVMEKEKVIFVDPNVPES
jgi:predicted ribosome quality control (RQC) complex YloA/Tae2 family protein